MEYIMTSTKETQYNDLLDDNQLNGEVKLGLTSGHTYRHDPRRLTFLLSRYKFVSKMLDGYANVLEVGCGDGFGGTLVADTVEHLVGMDFDPLFIENATNLRTESDNRSFIFHDILEAPLKNRFDAAYSLDVLEHISKEEESLFMENILGSLDDNGTLIIGMPSLESQDYASIQSKIGHINCKSGDELKTFCKNYFHNVFIFSMNDEVVHTGFTPMAHYLLALCTNPTKG